MSRPRALTKAQHKELASRHLIYMRARQEARRHSVTQLARDYRISTTSVQAYLERKV